MTKKDYSSINSKIEYLKNRNLEVSRLRNSLLHDGKIRECIDTIIKSYEESTVVKKITSYRQERKIEYRGFRSIGLFHQIEENEFFAEDYYWLPFFSDVGRALSRGERKYIHKRLGKYVRGVDETISCSNPNFGILDKYVVKLLDNNVKPNVILAPIQIYSEFMKRCWPELANSSWETDQIRIAECDIQIVWSHKYAPLRSFIIFNSSAGIWHALKDTEMENGITVAIGESQHDSSKIAYFAETMAYYEILNKDAFIRINLSY